VLNRYCIRPTTVDRIRASWIGDAVERYVAWLGEQNYAARNVLDMCQSCSDSDSLHKRLEQGSASPFFESADQDSRLIACDPCVSGPPVGSPVESNDNDALSRDSAQILLKTLLHLCSESTRRH
jgi:hypothetical protein